MTLISGDKQITFSLAGSLSELDRLSDNLKMVGDRWNLNEKTVLQMNLALDELFTNVVRLIRPVLPIRLWTFR